TGRDIEAVAVQGFSGDGGHYRVQGIRQAHGVDSIMYSVIPSGLARASIWHRK
ncbi:hypothetical protein G3V86_24335, partial [Escherichia coli]|nr:hypothetical protein [Escherichia coli]